MNDHLHSRIRRLGLRVASVTRALASVPALAALTQRSKSTLVYALVVSSLLTVGAKAQSNLLVAGDFEGISNPLPAYAAPTTGVWGTESSVLSGAGNGITPFGSQMLLLTHSGGGTASQTNQSVHGPFKAGSVVTFSVKFNTWIAASAQTPQTVAVSVMTDTGLALTGTRYTSPTVALDTNTSTWQTASVTVTLPSDTDYLSAEILLWMYSGALPFGTPLAYADDAVLTVVPPTPAVNWVNWTGTVSEGGVTKYLGHMVVPRTGGGSTTVNVKYTSPSRGIFSFQTSNNTDFFAQGQGGILGRNPARSPYTSAKVPNIPDGGGVLSDKSDMIRLQYAGTNKLEFFDASTGSPISIASPVFAYVSLNGNGYGFDQDFDILSFGDGSVRDQGYFGVGTSFKSVTTVNGAIQYQLLGTGEPHGTLQFRGSFSTVTWQSLSDEVWNGFTVGVAQLADDIPIANAGPDQTVTATSASGAAVQLNGSASGSTKTPFTFTWSGDFGTASGANPTVNLAVGTHTITLTVTDAANSSDTDTVDVTVLANPAPVITSANTATAVYGSPFTYTITATNSPTSFDAANLPAGLTLSGAVISGTPTVSGQFGVNLSAQNSGGTGTRSLLISINKANATVVVTPYNVTFDGSAHSSAITITGVNGDTGAAVGTVTHNTSHTDAGTYADSWSFTGSANYNSTGSTAITNTITKANATVTVNGYSGVYDGSAHGASGSVTGVGGVSLSAGLNLGATFTNVPGGSANWLFTGGTNYNDQSGVVAIVINKANATVIVAPYSVTYDGSTHSSSVTSITGVNGETGATVGTVSLNTTHIDAGTYADSWSFTGGANYNDIAASPISNTIGKANAAVVVAPYSVTYDGNAHSSSVTSITGVNGETGAIVGKVTLNTTHTNAGTYSDSWSLAGAANYNDIAATPITNSIARATATVLVASYSVTYDGAAHSSTITSITGVNGETGATVGTVTLNTTHTNAGTFADSWSLTGAANYNNIGATPITNAIAKANATIVVAPYSITYDGNAHSSTVTSIIGVNGETGATVGTVTLNTTHTNAGTYLDTWTLAGAANYNTIGATPITNAIAKANPVVTVTSYSVTYDGQPHTATDSAIGVKGEALSGLDVSGTTHTNAGSTTDAWVFTDLTGNYTNASGAVNDVIAKAATRTALGAMPSVQAVGQPITLTATVTALTPVVGSPDGTVTFTLGATVLGSATLNASGVAVLTTTAIPLGPQSVTASYGGSSNFIGSASSAVSVLVYGYPTGGGTFAIGDGNATVGTSVTFWGSQWEKVNSLSGGASNASFKGFAVGPTPPAAGGTFTAAPGNSGPSPASVPAYLGVIVTSKVTKSGSNITGTIVKLVVVKTDPGYGGDAGHAGTGTIVAAIQ